MQWDLSYFYKDHQDPSLLKDLKNALKESEEFENEGIALLSHQNIDTEKLKTLFKTQETIIQKIARAMQFAYLYFAQNTANADAQKLIGLCTNYEAKVRQKFAFLEPSLARLPDKTLEELEKQISAYRHVIEKIRLRKENTFSVETEQILAGKSNSGRERLSELYDKIVSDFSFSVTLDGEKKTFNGAQMRNLRYHPDSKIRRKAMKSFFKRYEENQIALTNLYNIIQTDYDTEATLRKFPSSISMRNQENETDDRTVKKLIEVTTENAVLVERYYRWKGKKLGFKMTPADIYAPFETVKKTYTFNEAKQTVLDAYSRFDKEFGSIVGTFFKERRIDSEIKPGKRAGAFCSYYFPDGKPFILLNFDGNIREIMTLAHELGHGIHGTLSSKQTFLNYSTPLTMAEIASVFGEMIVFDKLMGELDPKNQMLFLARTIEDMFATTFRQNMFARFEVASHQRIMAEGFVPWEDLCGLYKVELEKMFLSSLTIPEEYHAEWSSIPHIYGVPYYVYAYNFANLLVLSLYGKYLEEGKRFIPKYKTLLSSGGNDRPEKLLSPLGIDLTSDTFWQKGFDIIKGYIDRLEALTV